MIGVQSYGLSNALLYHPEETFQILTNIGFELLEPMIVLQETQCSSPICYTPYDRLASLWALTQAYPIKIESVHVSPHFNGQIHGTVIPVQEFAHQLLRLYREYRITDFVVSSKFSDTASAVFWGNYLRDVSKLLSDFPCHILYHNHDSEMRSTVINGTPSPLMDVFIDASRGDIMLELDIGWAGMVNDEVEIAKRYADLIHILHFKDFVPGSRGRITCETSLDEYFAPSGTGEIRTIDVLRLRSTFSNFNGKGIVEQNASIRDIFDDLRTGYCTIKPLLDETPS